MIWVQYLFISGNLFTVTFKKYLHVQVAFNVCVLKWHVEVFISPTYNLIVDSTSTKFTINCIVGTRNLCADYFTLNDFKSFTFVKKIFLSSYHPATSLKNSIFANTSDFCVPKIMRWIVVTEVRHEIFHIISRSWPGEKCVRWNIESTSSDTLRLQQRKRQHYFKVSERCVQ